MRGGPRRIEWRNLNFNLGLGIRNKYNDDQFKYRDRCWTLQRTKRQCPTIETMLALQSTVGIATPIVIPLVWINLPIIITTTTIILIRINAPVAHPDRLAPFSPAGQHSLAPNPLALLTIAHSVLFAQQNQHAQLALPNLLVLPNARLNHPTASNLIPLWSESAWMWIWASLASKKGGSKTTKTNPACSSDNVHGKFYNVYCSRTNIRCFSF
jgi:hypothetical protein